MRVSSVLVGDLTDCESIPDPLQFPQLHGCLKVLRMAVFLNYYPRQALVAWTGMVAPRNHRGHAWLKWTLTPGHPGRLTLCR